MMGFDFQPLLAAVGLQDIIAIGVVLACALYAVCRSWRAYSGRSGCGCGQSPCARPKSRAASPSPAEDNALALPVISDQPG